MYGIENMWLSLDDATGQHKDGNIKRLNYWCLVSKETCFIIMKKDMSYRIKYIEQMGQDEIQLI